MVNILLWNCRGFRNKKNELRKRIIDFDIIVLTETKCNEIKNQHVYLSGFKTYAKGSIESSGGIAISVRNNIEFDIIQQWERIGNEIDILGIRVKNTQQKNLVAIYRRPGSTTTKNKWKEIFEFEERQLETIFVGDFNAHNTAWNCQNTDKNGEYLWDITYEKELICINEGTESRIGDIGQIGSNIDLIFSTMEIADSLECEQSNEPWGSDHYPLKLKLKKEVQIYRKKTNKFTTKKTRWKEYAKAVQRVMQARTTRNEEEQNEDIEREYQEFIEIIKEAITNITDGGRTDGRNKSQNSIQKNQVRWWDEECEEAIKERRKAFKKFKEKKDTHSFEMYQQMKVQTRKIISKKKRKFRRILYINQ